MDAEVKIKLNDPALLRQQCYINGEWVDAASGQSIEVNNPATGEIIATVPSLSATEVRGSIEAADAADAAPGAPFVEVQALPDETLPFLLPSRFCESDRFGPRNSYFGGIQGTGAIRG